MLVATLTDLMNRIAANDREIAAINNRLPMAQEEFWKPNYRARYPGFVENGVHAVSLVQELRLPHFTTTFMPPTTICDRPHATSYSDPIRA